MNVHHLQAHVSRLPSHVNEHITPQVWFGLNQGLFSRGSLHPLLFIAKQDPTLTPASLHLFGQDPCSQLLAQTLLEHAAPWG
jgi:hypothetical protein